MALVRRDRALAWNRWRYTVYARVTLVTKPLLTDLTRRLGPFVDASPLECVHREPSLLGGFFQIAELRPPSSSSTAPAR